MNNSSTDSVIEKELEPLVSSDDVSGIINYTKCERFGFTEFVEIALVQNKTDLIKKVLSFMPKPKVDNT